MYACSYQENDPPKLQLNYSSFVKIVKKIAQNDIWYV